MQKEASENKKLIKKLQMEIENLNTQLTQANRVVTCMRAVFTEGQIRKIMTPGDLHWTWNDSIQSEHTITSTLKGFHYHRNRINSRIYIKNVFI